MINKILRLHQKQPEKESGSDDTSTTTGWFHRKPLENKGDTDEIEDSKHSALSLITSDHIDQVKQVSLVNMFGRLSNVGADARLGNVSSNADKRRIGELEKELKQLRDSTRDTIVKSWGEVERIQKENDLIQEEKAALVNRCEALEEEVESLRQITQDMNDQMNSKKLAPIQESAEHQTVAPPGFNDLNFRSSFVRNKLFVEMDPVHHTTNVSIDAENCHNASLPTTTIMHQNLRRIKSHLDVSFPPSNDTEKPQGLTRGISTFSLFSSNNDSNNSQGLQQNKSFRNMFMLGTGNSQRNFGEEKIADEEFQLKLKQREATIATLERAVDMQQQIVANLRNVEELKCEESGETNELRAQNDRLIKYTEKMDLQMQKLISDHDRSIDKKDRETRSFIAILENQKRHISFLTKEVEDLKGSSLQMDYSREETRMDSK